MESKKMLILITTIAMIVVVLSAGKAIGVQLLSANPGSANDPLVTKSYVDELLTELEKKLKNEFLEDDKDKKVVDNQLVVVELRDGQKLIGKAGTEIIVRTGEATIVAGENGIPNVTSGVDLAAGSIVPHNHLLITPRDDGRGIQCVPGYPRVVYVMVRGGYTLDSQ